jgi:hypothetical protein
MLFAWLGTKAFGLARGWWVLIALAALGGAILWLNAREEADDRANQDIGAAVQREADLRETIERTEQANDTRTEVREALARDDGRSRAVYDQCLRTARTPANCERFLPSGEAAER